MISNESDVYDNDSATTFLTDVVTQSASIKLVLPACKGAKEVTGVAPSTPMGGEAARRRALLQGPSRGDKTRAALRAHLNSLTEKKDAAGNKLVPFSENFIRKVKSGSQQNTFSTAQEISQGACKVLDSNGGYSNKSVVHDDLDKNSTDSHCVQDSSETEEDPTLAKIQQQRKKGSAIRKKSKMKSKIREHNDKEQNGIEGEKVGIVESTECESKPTLSQMQFIEEIEANDNDADTTTIAASSSKFSNEVGSLHQWQKEIEEKNVLRSRILGPSKADRVRTELRALLSDFSRQVNLPDHLKKEIEVNFLAFDTRIYVNIARLLYFSNLLSCGCI